MTFDYGGPRGHLKDVTICFEINRYDGPLSGMCEVDGNLLLFEYFGEDEWIPYMDTDGLDKEGFEEELKKLNESIKSFSPNAVDLTVEEYLEEHDIIRKFAAHYVPDEWISLFIEKQELWEWASCTIHGVEVGSEEDAKAQVSFNERLDHLKENKRYQELKQVTEFKNVISLSNRVGWFLNDDIQANFRRIDLAPKRDQKRLRGLVS